MKAACVVLTVLILVAIMAVCIMVKFATEITLQEQKRDQLSAGAVHSFARTTGVISLRENTSRAMAERFPYVAAIIRNASNTWAFSCFASVVLVNWVVTSAHCKRPRAIHRVLIYRDLTTNYSHTHAILLWRLHESFNSGAGAKYDIAAAKINVDSHPYALKPASLNERWTNAYITAAIWKTVSTMDKSMFLTNDFGYFDVEVVPGARCAESYGMELDDSLFCVGLAGHGGCFAREFGPLYAGDRVVGVLAAKPRDCDVKFAIFTNVSYYAGWILKATNTGSYRF